MWISKKKFEEMETKIAGLMESHAYLEDKDIYVYVGEQQVGWFGSATQAPIIHTVAIEKLYEHLGLELSQSFKCRKAKRAK